jgi:type II restriction/modification system DNA methylase subunit YeeA
MAGKAAPKKASKPRAQFDRLVKEFAQRVAQVKILDPACGSGNFLFTAIRLLLDLEKEIYRFASQYGVALLPQVRPTQLAGIEINRYAQELAQVVIWIGYLQWKRHNGFPIPRNPVLDPIDSIRCMDAVLDLANTKCPAEPEWPEAEFIVGNPPFLGDKKMLNALGEGYVTNLRNCYSGRVPGGADLVAYWFDKARIQIQCGKTKRAGLLATQSIRVGANRSVLDAIRASGAIFFGESDRAWIVDGADVRVAMVGFDNGTETRRFLDGRPATIIFSNLTSAIDLTVAQRLQANQGVAFVGSQKGGAFDISALAASEMLHTSGNPHLRPNSDVIRPSANGFDVTRRNRNMFIIDFGTSTAIEFASQYHAPFQYLSQHVAPKKALSREVHDRSQWWLHTRSRPAMRAAFGNQTRFIATARVAKHRVFIWLGIETIPDSRLYVFASSEDSFFGILQSRIHEVWSLATSPRHGVGNDPTYNAQSCFETFPMIENAGSDLLAVAMATVELDRQRNNWLNPPDWTREEILEFPGSMDGPWKRYVHNPDARGIGTVRYPRLVPVDEGAAKQLAKRTLTNLYNQRPTWLDLAHRRLDEAVFSAYGWPADLSDDQILERLLKLNLERQPAKKPSTRSSGSDEA